MRDGTSRTNPIDDYENGVITFEELCDIIESMPHDDVTPEEQEYYRKLALWAETAEISPTAKIYRGAEARQRGRDMLRKGLEYPQ